MIRSSSAEFLIFERQKEEHGVEVTSIGTSKEDIDTWIDTLKNCK